MFDDESVALDEIYAHTPDGSGRWQPLIEHLESVAALASEFCSGISASDIGYWIGLWHDVGKFSPAFQAYLHACAERPNERHRGPDHKAAGTKLALNHLGLAALTVQGHHGGLHTRTEMKTWFAEKAKLPATEEALHRARLDIPNLEPSRQIALPEWARQDKLAAEFFIRILFSALVDADSLDTERHWRLDKAMQRGNPIGLGELWSRFEQNQEEFTRAGHTPRASQTVRSVRNAVYQDCLRAADLPPGLFRLNVPTGGGKTRSAMAFALRQALKNDQRRIIMAVPFITITEQTAETYRQIFEDPGDETPVVLEHHSSVRQTDQNDDDFHSGAIWQRLAAENWDAPIVVTTTVQLFESLFSNMRGLSRKVHRLANSVLILDEAQALPISLLDPILDGLRELCEHYGTTVVLSTATQPTFEAIPVFASLPARDIVPNANQYFARLKRVTYEWHVGDSQDWESIAQLLSAKPQALAILNTKRDALALLDALDDDSALHLSTLLCGAHRRQVIATVKNRLSAGAPCRLISTQVIEAGVDIDFPVVLRALGPLDAIIQSAGRCNREGRYDYGRVVVFRPSDGGLPPGDYTVATGITEVLLNAGLLNPDDPATAREYFRRLFASVPTDAHDIQPIRNELNYPVVAERFRMIPSSENIIITGYGTERQRRQVRQYVEELRAGAPNSRFLLRQLQPYMVSLSSFHAERYRQRSLITQILPGIGEWHGRYDAVRGILAETESVFIV
jgi:CRISPR-associated endonuclease/helicase Cas3